MKHLILYAIVLLSIIGCKKNDKETDYLGIVNIEISGDKEAIPHFEKGLLLLHSFEYEDARESFKNAQSIDPNLAMAYWGEAMTHNHGLWQEQDYEAASKIIEQLNIIKDKQNLSELEQDFITAINILYQPQIDKNERDDNYSNYLESLMKKYPNNHEVAAFYALSLLASSEDGRDEELYGKGAKIAQGIIEENPNHPGALHYLIHSYDDPTHAHLALSAADSYAKVAPDASHALHMPSHIYVAKGMWDEVISSNINSYQASLNRMNRKNLDNDARGYHAFHWLEYGYLQKENKVEPRKMVLDMQSYMSETPSKRARVHMVFLKGTYLVETDDWSDKEIADIEVDISDLNVSIRSQYQFIEGMKAFESGDTVLMDSIINTMGADYKRESYIVSNSGSKLCSALTRDEATESDLIEAEIRQHQLKGLRATLENNNELAEEHFLQSISLFEGINYSYGPPHIQKPTHELYADWLVSQNRMKEAADYYKKALNSAPKRTRVTKALEKIETI